MTRQLLLLATLAACSSPPPCPCGDCDVDVRTDIDHCGACGRMCEHPHAESRCEEGRCVMGACEVGFADADGISANGCEREDFCAGSHARGVRGQGGVCLVSECEPGWVDVNGSPDDGCECEYVGPTDSVCSPRGDPADDDCDGTVDEDFAPSVISCRECRDCLPLLRDDPGRAWTCEPERAGDPCVPGECRGGFAEDAEGLCVSGETRCDGLDDDGDGHIDNGRCESVIPGGVPFVRGAEAQGTRHVLMLPYDLAMDTFEVSVGAYKECLLARAAGDDSACEEVPQCRFDAASDAGNDEPVGCVTWCGAWRYCRWVGKRLPTDAENNRAVRGLDGAPFPWGPRCPETEDECSRANVAAPPCDRIEGRPGPAPVEADHDVRATADGLNNIYGNVGEWLYDWGSDYGPSGQFWGGLAGPRAGGRKTFSMESRFLDVTWRAVNSTHSIAQGRILSDLGFRCARTLGPVHGSTEDDLPSTLRSDAPSMPLPGDSVDCSFDPPCGDPVPAPYMSIYNLRAHGETFSNTPPLFRTILEQQLRGGVRGDGQPFFFVEAPGAEAAGSGARAEWCSRGRWLAVGEQEPRVPTAMAPVNDPARCQGSCYAPVDDEPLPIYVRTVLDRPLLLRSFRIELPGPEVDDRGRMLSYVLDSDLADVRLLPVPDTPLNVLIGAPNFDSTGDGEPDAHRFDLTFAREGQRDSEEPVTYCYAEQ